MGTSYHICAVGQEKKSVKISRHNSIVLIVKGKNSWPSRNNLSLLVFTQSIKLCVNTTSTSQEELKTSFC